MWKLRNMWKNVKIVKKPVDNMLNNEKMGNMKNVETREKCDPFSLVISM